MVTGYGHTAARVSGNGITSAELDLSGIDTPFVRLTVRDHGGGRAWSNPIWL
jgi:hypothetical protein